MDRLFKSRTRVYFIIVLVLTIAAWGRLIAMSFINPSPFREMRRAESVQTKGRVLGCSGPTVVTSRYLYQLMCTVEGDILGYGVLRFDMARGVLDNVWSVPDLSVSPQENGLLEFKLIPDGGVALGVTPYPKSANAGVYAQLVPGLDAQLVEPPSSLPQPPEVISPQADPVSSSRLSEAALGKNWVVYAEYDYVLDDSGHLNAVKVWTGRTNSAAVPPGIIAFSQVGLKDRWVVVERRQDRFAGRDGYEAVLEDSATSASGVVPIDRSIFPGDVWRLAVPDAEGGLWVFDDNMTYAHFDSTLRRSDPLTIFERFERMQVDHYRDFTGMNWWYADSRFWLEAAGYTIRQLSTLVLLFGLPVLGLIAWLIGRREGFPDGIALRRAAQVYLGLFVVLVYWYWVVTATF